MTGRPINQDRQNAIDLGLRFYEGSKHARCGTTLRYVAGGGCVHCARVISTEQREARKFLQQHALDEAEEKVREDDGVVFPGSPGSDVNDAIPPHEIEVDKPVDDGLDSDDAEARRQASIDELM